MGVSLISNQPTRDALEEAVSNVFTTFMRPFSLYIQAQTATITTDPNYSRFGQNDQNSFQPPVNAQVYTVSGTILYGQKQVWDWIEPTTRSHYDQNKLRNDMGQVRIKVDETGNALLSQCKLVCLDGFNFKLTTAARKHGLFSVQRFTYYLERVD